MHNVLSEALRFGNLSMTNVWALSCAASESFWTKKCTPTVESLIDQSTDQSITPHVSSLRTATFVESDISSISEHHLCPFGGVRGVEPFMRLRLPSGYLGIDRSFAYSTISSSTPVASIYLEKIYKLLHASEEVQRCTIRFFGVKQGQQGRQGHKHHSRRP